jgi:hypothetical protein
MLKDPAQLLASHDGGVDGQVTTLNVLVDDITLEVEVVTEDIIVKLETGRVVELETGRVVELEFGRVVELETDRVVDVLVHADKSSLG